MLVHDVVTLLQPTIGRQQGEARLHINPLAVPGDDPVDGHGVPQVMEAGLPAVRPLPSHAEGLPLSQ
jgi:hypothetical protein